MTAEQAEALIVFRPEPFRRLGARFYGLAYSLADLDQKKQEIITLFQSIPEERKTEFSLETLRGTVDEIKEEDDMETLRGVFLKRSIAGLQSLHVRLT